MLSSPECETLTSTLLSCAEASTEASINRIAKMALRIESPNVVAMTDDGIETNTALPAPAIADFTASNNALGIPETQ